MPVKNSIPETGTARKPAVKPKRTLHPEDRKNLKASGLSDATIEASGIYSVLAAEAVQMLRLSGISEDGMVIPYRNINGRNTDHFRFRPRRPMKLNGTLAKYLQPRRTLINAYFPGKIGDALGDTDKRIYIVEGEKKALALHQHGYAVIGVGGIRGGYRLMPDESHELIAGLKMIPWEDRDVVIVFDWDRKEGTRQQTAGAIRRMGGLLRKAGAARVRWVDLAPVEDAEAEADKVGIDDYLLKNGTQAFASLVDESEVVASDRVNPIGQASGRTDLNNAYRLVDRHGKDIQWSSDRNQFLSWDGGRWKRENSAWRVEEYAKDIAKGLWKEVGALAAKEEADPPEKSESQLGRATQFATRSNNASGMKDMVTMLRGLPEIKITDDVLDTHPDLLNVRNGTIDLTTGEIREHCRKDNLTAMAPVDHDPEAECPVWEAFLNTIFSGDEELIGYIQRQIGMSLTGHAKEHQLVFLYGSGANGKSTLCGTVLKLLGRDYAMQAAPGLLLASSASNPDPESKMRLEGKRFVACTETDSGKKMAEALLKQLTGGDRVSGRMLYGHETEFEPTHHLWIAGNHKPIITGTDHGIWRRIKLVPLTVTIAPAKQDKDLPQKLEAELPGILNWAIRGCLDWQQNGLNDPKIVIAATEEYRNEQDMIGRFINECCETGEAYTDSASKLFREFQSRMGDTTMSQSAFGTQLGERGFPSEKVKGNVVRKGLRLIETGDTERRTAEFFASQNVQKGGRSNG